MFKHGYTEPISPTRVVVLGASGFVAAATVRRLLARGVPVVGLPRVALDLAQTGAGEKLARALRPSDALLFVAAKAPVKNEEMLIENLRMAAAVSEAIRQTPVNHVVYVSSDAVYADSGTPLTEQSCTQPTSLHGVMHLAREVILANAFMGPLCLLRPTLIYGADDPHNGYGPNRFMRLALAGKPIEIFGEGEEQRDHIWIEDVAEIVARVLMHQSHGVLNIATGSVASFANLARVAATLFPGGGVKSSPRSGVMPHNGFRPFDVTALRRAFPDYQCVSACEGIENLRDAYEAKSPD
jgi:UDP-glucose 4-epimerase